jgi:hypothetical protein
MNKKTSNVLQNFGGFFMKIPQDGNFLKNQASFIWLSQNNYLSL